MAASAIVVTLLFLLPFCLETAAWARRRQTRRLAPAPVLIAVLAGAEILLAWMPAAWIADYALLTGIGYAYFGCVGAAALAWMAHGLVRRAPGLTAKGWLSAMRPALVVAACAAVPLIVTAAVPAMTILSDIQAYAAAGSFFRGGSGYTFDGINGLELFYRLPVGFYLNASLANGADFAAGYDTAWMALTYQLVGWTVAYLARFRLASWTERARLAFVALAAGAYALVSLAIPPMLASGNTEMQVVFLAAALVLAADRNFAAAAMTPFAALLFSSTALLAFPVPLIAYFGYALWRGSRRDAAVVFIAGAAFALMDIAVFYRSAAGDVGVEAAVGAACCAAALSAAAACAAPRWRWASEPATNGRFRSSLAWRPTWRPRPGRARALLSVSAFLAAWLAAALTTYFVVAAARPEKLIIIAPLICCTIASAAAFVRAHFRGDVDPVFRLLTAQCALYVLFAACIAASGLFVDNASAWRFAYSSGTFGYFGCFLVILNVAAVGVWEACPERLLALRARLTARRTRRPGWAWTGGAAAAAAIAAAAAPIGVWAAAGTAAQPTPAADGGQQPAPAESAASDGRVQPSAADLALLTAIDAVSRPVAPDARSSSAAPSGADGPRATEPDTKYSYYSDVNLTGYLSQMGVFAFGSNWESTLLDDFVRSDRQMHDVQGKPVSDMLYYTPRNAAAVINKVLDDASENAAAGWVFVKDGDGFGPGIKLKDPPAPTAGAVAGNTAAADPQTPLTADDVAVVGAPDLVILNAATAYYRLLLSDYWRGGAPSGYVLLAKTDAMAYYVLARSELSAPLLAFVGAQQAAPPA